MILANERQYITASIGVTASPAPTYFASTSSTLGSSVTSGTLTTSDTVVVAAPTSALSMTVSLMSIFNADDAGVTLTIKFYNAGVASTLWSGTLSAGETLQYVPERGFQTIDSTGRIGSGESFPSATSASIVSAQTSATGSTYVAFGSSVCNALDIVNNTGTSIEYRRGGAGSTVAIPDGSSRLIVGITNANEISLKRVDSSNTQVTITAEAIVV